MADTHKTKAEMLQELESIKGLLLEEDDIPILQEMEADEWRPEVHPVEQSFIQEAPPVRQHESVLPGQGSLFEEPTPTTIKHTEQLTTHPLHAHQEHKKHGFASHLTPNHHHTTHASTHAPTHAPTHASSHTPAQTKPLAKASGENPFLPQHIRDRLHGNNPPPLFEYETAKKIISATKNIAHKTNKPRQHLIDDVIQGMMPQIETELRHRLFAMSVEELEKLLNEDEDV